MTENELANFKISLISLCKNQLERRIAQCQEQMRSAQEAANEEEKSSAGDKYETSRAMSQLNKDMYARQLMENQEELSMFLSLIKQEAMGVVKAGNLVDCDKILFFIAVGLGKLEFEGRTLVVLSPSAPLAKNLIGKRIGDSIAFNNSRFQIIGIS
jgi:hypothetical protein